MLELRDLCLSKGSFRIQDVSLGVAEHEYFALVGPTGCGKTLLLETIAGLERPLSGAVLMDGDDVTDREAEERNVGYVPQDYALFPHMSVEGNILSGCLARRVPREEALGRAREMADLLGIGHLLPRRIRGLSGGERQRVALARALVTHPRILLLDEPLAALDPSTRSRLWRGLKRVHQALRLTTIHVTHDFQEAHALADMTGLMHNGRFLQIGPPAEVFRQPVNRLAARFVGVPNILEGEASSRAQGGCVVRVSEALTLRSEACREGPVDVFIHPEDVIVGDDQGAGENVVEGVLEAVLDRGETVELTLDLGFLLVVTEGRRRYRSLGLREGQAVTATIPAEAVHLAERTAEG
jgi:ABC-type sugar transport system ATPase subunit